MRSVSGDRSRARTSDIGLRRDPQPPMPMVIPSERVAIAMAANEKASHRVLLLSDGHANEGLAHRGDLARHAGELLMRGIITAAVGIGDDYDEALLGAMTEAGGGRLHDAARPHEIGEVVVGELLEGRSALLERTMLRFVIPANVRAELVGSWSHSVLPGAIEVLVGMLLPESPKRIVLRLHCPADVPGTTIVLGASANGVLPDGSGEIEAAPDEVQIRLVSARENNAQPQDIERSVDAFTAWRAAAMRRTVDLNREGDRREAKYFLERELRWLEPYARGLPGTEAPLAELVLLLRRADRQMNSRLSKTIYTRSTHELRSQRDLRSAPQPRISELLRKELEKALQSHTSETLRKELKK